ncbi:MAG: ClpXP protease specificity-enhancing factor SspB [Pseudomonadota bacterium]
MSRRIHYGRLMHAALRGLMAEVLSDVAAHGLPGEHHFFITFSTDHPGVDIPDYLRERHPDEMTIILQEWFDNLTVAGDRFAVTLNFGDVPEPLVIPFDAIKTFVDPSVEFGLRFDSSAEEDAEDEGLPMALEEDPLSPGAADEDPPEDPGPGGDVVSLDRFRKS